MFANKAVLILASGSPRRRDFLQDIGLDFSVEAPDVSEEVSACETPEEFVLRVAADKARSVAREHPDAWILAADTAVVLGDVILGKPADEADARRMLLQLAGRGHRVLTGFVLVNEQQGHRVSRVIDTEVFFTSFSGETAAAYVATGEPLDKAGAYGIQGKGGCLVERIKGSYSNVVGLPLAEVTAELLRFGVVVWRK